MSMMTHNFEAEQYLKQLKTSLSAFSWRCHVELNPGKPFVDEPHRRAVAHQLERMLVGLNRRYMTSLPPRSGKTELVSVAYIAFALMLNPALRFILTTYGSELSEEIMRKLIRIMNAPWYTHLASHGLLASTSLREIKTSANGGVLALGMGGALTGRGGDIIIVDDILKAVDISSEAARAAAHRFFTEVLYSRLDNKEKGSIVVAQQRLHLDDFIGALVERGGWNYQNYPAIAQEDEEFPLGKGLFFRRKRGEALTPARESLASLEETRAMIGTPAFNAQYLGMPSPAAGNMVRREWFGRWKRLPDRSEVRVVMSIDTAGSGNPGSDYSVITVWWQVGKRHLLVDVVRERLGYSDLRSRIIELNAKHKPDATLIKNTWLGSGLIDDLRRNWLMTIFPITPRGDKAGRLALVQPMFENGEVWIPDADEPWVETYLAELLAFPDSKHDDQVDSTTQYLRWVRDGGPDGFSCVFVGPNSPGPGLWDPMEQYYRLSAPIYPWR